MICALTVGASKKLGAWFGNQRKDGATVHKEYVARCVGEFPDGVVTCEEPLLTIDRQIGINVVHPDGRCAETLFERMSYDSASNTSVVHCRPITGRSHQIRVHLQFLGFPIANDPIYQNKAAWGENGGKGGVFRASLRGGSEEDRQRRRDQGDLLMQHVKTEGTEIVEMALKGENADKLTQEVGDEASTLLQRKEDLDRKPHDLTLTEAAQDAITALRDVKDEADGWARSRDLRGVEQANLMESRGCRGTAEKALGFSDNSGPEPDPFAQRIDGAAPKALEEMDRDFCRDCFTPLVADPRPEQLFIWLHALRYKTLDWDYSSPLPYWAESDYVVPAFEDGKIRASLLK